MADRLVSGNGEWELVAQNDGNLVWQRVADGYVGWSLDREKEATWPPPPVGGPGPAPSPPPPGSWPDRPKGLVRKVDRAFADDARPAGFLSLGASLFWAWWGEKHEPQRLDDNLKVLHGFDYVRILSMVGSDSWRDRVIDPRDPRYWVVMNNLMERLATHGLRAHVTLFADAQVMMPDQALRRQWVDSWAEFASTHNDHIHSFEIANEYFLNGLNQSEVRELAMRLSANTNVLVAASTPSQSYPEEVHSPADQAVVEEWQELYGNTCDMVTMHFDRDCSKTEGPWRPVRQPWECQFVPDVPTIWMNNEPIGPQSSVAEDDDPHRIVSAAIVTWIATCGAYCLHTGAGIRGGGQVDLDKGRSANLWEVPNIDTIVKGLLAMKALLPPDLPNWSPQNHHWVTHPLYNSFEHHIWPDGAGAGVVRAFASTWGSYYVCLPMGIRGRFDVVVDASWKKPVVIDILTGQILSSGEQVVTLDEQQASAVLIAALEP